MSDKLKEKVVGTSEAAEKPKAGLGAKDSVKRAVAKGGAKPAGAKDSATPAGAKDGTLGAKD